MGEETERIRRVMPPEKWAQKKAVTLTGLALTLLGFCITAAGIHMWYRFDFRPLLLAPTLIGIFVALVGAHISSGEVVGAALRDVGGTVVKLLRFWRRNGNGS